MSAARVECRLTSKASLPSCPNCAIFFYPIMMAVLSPLPIAHARKLRRVVQRSCSTDRTTCLCCTDLLALASLVVLVLYSGCSEDMVRHLITSSKTLFTRTVVVVKCIFIPIAAENWRSTFSSSINDARVGFGTHRSIL